MNNAPHQPPVSGPTVPGVHTRLGVPHNAELELLGFRASGLDVYHCKGCDEYASEQTVQLLSA